MFQRSSHSYLKKSSFKTAILPQSAINMSKVSKITLEQCLIGHCSDVILLTLNRYLLACLSFYFNSV